MANLGAGENVGSIPTVPCPQYMSTTAVVAVPCVKCNELNEIHANLEGFVSWQQGELIQNALPELSVDQRELLISGICPKCWDEMFPSDED
jgi:uncharacterized protein YqfB (UPF0267 family)